MRPLFKTVGLITVFLVCCLFGLLKSEEVKKENELALLLVSACNRMAELIRTERRKLSLAVEASFKAEWVLCKDKKFYVNRTVIGKDQADILDELFSSVGMMDSESEYRRIRLYAERLEQSQKRAAKKALEQGRLYKTLGVSFGVFMVLFLI